MFRTLAPRGSSEQRVVLDASYAFHVEQPQALIDAVRDLVAGLALSAPNEPTQLGAVLASGSGRATRAAGLQLVARDSTSLESCAVQPEALRMIAGRTVTRAYNGHFVFAAEDQITSAKWDRTPVRIFEANDR